VEREISALNTEGQPGAVTIFRVGCHAREHSHRDELGLTLSPRTIARTQVCCRAKAHTGDPHGKRQEHPSSARPAPRSTRSTCRSAVDNYCERRRPRNITVSITKQPLPMPFCRRKLSPGHRRESGPILSSHQDTAPHIQILRSRPNPRCSDAITDKTRARGDVEIRAAGKVYNVGRPSSQLLPERRAERPEYPHAEERLPFLMSQSKAWMANWNVTNTTDTVHFTSSIRVRRCRGTQTTAAPCGWNERFRPPRDAANGWSKSGRLRSSKPDAQQRRCPHQRAHLIVVSGALRADQGCDS